MREEGKDHPATGRTEAPRPARLLLFGLALAALALFAIACGGGATGDSGGQGQQEAVEDGPGTGAGETVAAVAAPYLGDPGAPVVLVEYADFQ